MYEWLVTHTDRRNGSQPLQATVDNEGRLVLPAEVRQAYGLAAGVVVLIDPADNSFALRRPSTHLARVYIEPTNACNLTCSMCIRHNWDEPAGRMTDETFTRVLEGLRALPQPFTVFFGGYGEPLFHRSIVDMVHQAKSVGARVELITNGTLLHERMSRRLIEAGLDMLWVSLDGATPESYSDVRLAQALPSILENLQRFHALRLDVQRAPDLGIAFVAMRRNITDLPDILRIGERLSVKQYSISGVLPHTEDMCDEVLYTRTISEGLPRITHWSPQVKLPRLDVNERTREALYHVLRSGRNISLGGAVMSQARDRCPFIERGATVIAWNGDVSPCMVLLHNHISYLNRRQRISRKYVAGNINRRALTEIWLSPEYVAFRELVQRFEFSPCSFCGGCNLAESNEEDCFGNMHPTCGGCLWAQGVIQCP